MLGIAAAVAPALLLIASLVYGLIRPVEGLAGPILAMPAAAVALCNFNLSFLRPRRYLRVHGSFDGYRYVSGFPGIGSILVVLTGAFAFGQPYAAALALVAYGLDTGGIPWFVHQTWNDTSLWGE